MDFFERPRRRVWIDSREGAAVITRTIDGRERADCSKISRRSQPVVGIIGLLCAGTDGALNAVEIGAAPTVKRLVRRRNSLEGGSLIEVANVPGMVLIDSEKVVRLNVAQVICAESHSWSEFTLDADIHLE
jgi:hypothetical protein